MSGKDTFDEGTATVEEFFYWINERQAIYNRRQSGFPKPWTKDEILQNWKFTNAYRELDRGTVALRKMLPVNTTMDPELIFFNIAWYRLFNLDRHAQNYNLVTNMDQKNALYAYLRKEWEEDRKVFTSAHMTTGVAGERKVDTYIEACENAWDNRSSFVQDCKSGTMEHVFNALLGLYMVGRFVGYEIVCDMRFYPTFWPTGEPLDVTTWANMGPGAARGLARLGLLENRRSQEQGLVAMRKLYEQRWDFLDVNIHSGPRFELREIEHSLCEFDKYQRVKRREGQARVKFNGRA